MWGNAQLKNWIDAQYVLFEKHLYNLIKYALPRYYITTIAWAANQYTFLEGKPKLGILNNILHVNIAK